jgi:hypothetical protein
VSEAVRGVASPHRELRREERAAAPSPAYRAAFNGKMGARLFGKTALWTAAAVLLGIGVLPVSRPLAIAVTGLVAGAQSAAQWRRRRTVEAR